METTVFTPTQIQLLKLFKFNKDEESLKEMKEVLHNYYAKKMDAHLNKLWDEGILNQKRLDEINGMDLHAWLREQKAKEQNIQ